MIFDVQTVLGSIIGFNADPDPAFYLNAEDPDPESQINADQCGSGSGSRSDFSVTKRCILT
jgi:hypothetical protein